MFGLFNKLKSAPTDDAEAVVPDQLWDGDIAEALRAAGLTHDDEDGAESVGADAVDTQVDRDVLEHEARLAEQNARIAATHPGCSVATQFILTAEVWEGRHAELLRDVLELTPYWPSNTRFLPADEASAEALDLPVYYDGPIARILEVADAHIDLIVERAGIADIAAAYAADESVKEAMRHDLAALAEYYFEAMLPMLRGED